jgi:hypothetical protein
MNQIQPPRTFAFFDNEARTAALIEDTIGVYPTAARVVFRWLTWHDEASPEAVHVLDRKGADLATGDSLAFLDRSATDLTFGISTMSEWTHTQMRDGNDRYELTVRRAPKWSMLRWLRSALPNAEL